MTDGLVEAVARALYACDEHENSPVWRQLSAQIVSEYKAEAQAALAAIKTSGFAVVPVGRPRCELASGNTIDEIRANLSRELHATGDCVLVWMNEGDLIQIGFDAMIAAAGDKP